MIENKKIYQLSSLEEEVVSSFLSLVATLGQTLVGRVRFTSEWLCKMIQFSTVIK